MDKKYYNINYRSLKGGYKKLEGNDLNCYEISNYNIINNLSNFKFYIGNVDNNIKQDREIKQNELASYELLPKYICLKFSSDWINNAINYTEQPLAKFPFFSQYNTYGNFYISDIFPQRIFCKKIGEIYYIIQTVPDKDDPTNTNNKHLLWRPHGFYIENIKINFNINGYLKIINIENSKILFDNNYACSAHDNQYSGPGPQIDFKEVWDLKKKFHLYFVEYNNIIVNSSSSDNFKGYFKLIHEDYIDSTKLKNNFENFFNTNIIN